MMFKPGDWAGQSINPISPSFMKCLLYYCDGWQPHRCSFMYLDGEQHLQKMRSRGPEEVWPFIEPEWLCKGWHVFPMKGNWQPFLIQKYLGLIWRNSKAKALERVGTLLSTKGGNICAAVLEGGNGNCSGSISLRSLFKNHVHVHSDHAQKPGPWRLLDLHRG